MPHYDALVLNLCINDFDVHRVLADLGSATDLLQLSAFKQMKFSLGMLNSARRILSGFNNATTTTLGDVALPVKVGPMTQRVNILNHQRLRALQRHNGAGLAVFVESYPFNLPSNDQLFD